MLQYLWVYRAFHVLLVWVCQDYFDLRLYDSFSHKGFFLALMPISIMQWRVEIGIFNVKFYVRCKSYAVNTATLHNSRNFNHVTINISIAMRRRRTKSWA